MMVTAHVLSRPMESCRSQGGSTWHLADKKEAEEKDGECQQCVGEGIRTERPGAGPVQNWGLGRAIRGTYRAFRWGQQKQRKTAALFLTYLGDCGGCGLVSVCLESQKPH